MKFYAINDHHVLICFAFFLQELFTENTDVKLRYDLLDCGISVCSTEVHRKQQKKLDVEKIS